MQDVPLLLDFNGKQLKGFAVPLSRTAQQVPTTFDIIVDKAFLGTLRCDAQGWKMDTAQDPKLVSALGRCILSWYISMPQKKQEDPY
jgi:hypothetical protein